MSQRGSCGAARDDLEPGLTEWELTLMGPFLKIVVFQTPTTFAPEAADSIFPGNFQPGEPVSRSGVSCEQGMGLWAKGSRTWAPVRWLA